MTPAEVWWSGLPATGAAWEALTASLRETGTPVRRLRAGDTIPDFPEVDVVHPPRTWTTASPNEGSLVLRVRVGPTSILFTGDAERDAEAAMLDRSNALGAVGQADEAVRESEVSAHHVLQDVDIVDTVFAAPFEAGDCQRRRVDPHGWPGAQRPGGCPPGPVRVPGLP